MRFAFTDDQLAFAAALRELLAAECTAAHVRATDASATRLLAILLDERIERHIELIANIVATVVQHAQQGAVHAKQTRHTASCLIVARRHFGLVGFVTDCEHNRNRLETRRLLRATYLH